MKVNPVEAKRLMDENNDIYIVDVREKEELAEGYIENSLLIPLAQIPKLASEIIPDKNKTILVYCRSGRRSAIAAKELKDLGYTNVVDIGGIIDWPFEKII